MSSVEYFHMNQPVLIWEYNHGYSLGLICGIDLPGWEMPGIDQEFYNYDIECRYILLEPAGIIRPVPLNLAAIKKQIPAKDLKPMNCYEIFFLFLKGNVNYEN